MTEIASILIDGTVLKPGSRKLLPVYDPGHPNEVVGQVVQATAADVDAAVRSAHSAFLKWRNVPLAERTAQLLKAADQIGPPVPELATLLTREMGKILQESLIDAGGAEFLLRNVVSLAEEGLRDEVRSDEFGATTVTPAPLGVVAGIVPWNWPMGLMMTKVAYAVSSGDTIVCLPSPYASLAVTRMLATMAAVLPPGVINVLTGAGSEVGPALTRHPLVRAVSFTGGTETGRSVLRAIADGVKIPMLELGGNDPALVLDDAEINTATAASLLSGALVTSGQVCLAIKRVYVARTRFDELVDALGTVMSGSVVGHGLDPTSTLGPLANGNQLKRAQAMVDEVIERDGIIHRFGEKNDSFDPDGYYMMPKLITGVDDSYAIVRDEQFAPALPVLPFDTVDEAVSRANDSEFGLSASVWSADRDRARQVAARVEAGTVFVNQHGPAVTDVTLPMGGWKQSGIGREQGAHGFSHYVELRQINDRHLPLPG